MPALMPSWSHMGRVASGIPKLFGFYKWSLGQHFSLPQELYDEAAMAKRMAKGEAFDITVENGRDFVREYETRLQKLGDELPPSPGGSFAVKQMLFWGVRGLCIACAFTGSFKLTILASLLQFVALPYSSFVAVAYGLETVAILYGGPILVHSLLRLLLDCIIPAHLNVTLTLGPWFLILFLVVDQAVCAACLFWTPKGKTASMPLYRVLQSVVYGFLNCKTYYMVLLPLTFGLQVPLCVWLVDWAFGLSERIVQRTSRVWEAAFYHVHRLGHLRHVYVDAHKFHHHLPDCCAFDAHIFGSGAPEEWPLLVCDLTLAHFGHLPACLSYPALRMSWLNKWRFHSRSDQPEGHTDNFHADHHAKHNLNFGMYAPFELFMNTLFHKPSKPVEHQGYNIQRLEQGSSVTLKFMPVRAQATGAVRPGMSRRWAISGA